MKSTPKADMPLVKMLQESIIAEQTAGDFYLYIAGILQDKKTAGMFLRFGRDEAQRHKELLAARLQLITGKAYDPDLTQLHASIKVSSFSLAGALKIAREAESKAIEFYGEARKKDTGYARMYQTIIKDEKRHWAALHKLLASFSKDTVCRSEKGARIFSRLLDTI